MATLRHYTSRHEPKPLAHCYCTRHRDRARDLCDAASASIRRRIYSGFGLRTDLDAGQAAGRSVSRSREREPRVSVAITCIRGNHPERHHIPCVARWKVCPTRYFRVDGDWTATIQIGPSLVIAPCLGLEVSNTPATRIMVLLSRRADHEGAVAVRTQAKLERF
jgi:hypothetical protein